MTKLDLLKASNMWDARYNLPTSPQNNNPWFYMACTVRCGAEIPAQEAISYWRRCQNDDATLNRWPGSPSEISQDELLGAVYLFDVNEAPRTYGIILVNFGTYSNTGRKPWWNLSYNLFRFPWFIQYLRASAFGKIGIIGQLLWSFLIVSDLLTFWKWKTDASGRLTIWLQIPRMEGFPICAWFIRIWKNRMKAAGVTPKATFALEPKENPVMVEIAPEEW